MPKHVLSSARAVALLVAASLLASGFAVAQCAPQFLPGDGIAGVAGGGNSAEVALQWDPDGAGPITPKWVVGGSFTRAGLVAASNLAMFDPTTGAWAQIGGGVDGTVIALATLPTGELVVAGAFAAVGGQPANHIAVWNGVAWSTLGTGMNASVHALTVLPNGELVAGGAFTTADGFGANRVAKWNGFGWAAIGAGFGSGTVFGLTVRTNGDLVACGSFPGRVNRWTGSAWSGLGGNPNSAAYSVAALPNGDIVVGGDFSMIGLLTVNGVARWNGTSWSALASGLGVVYCVGVSPTGQLFAGGTFGGLRAWNGSAWSSVGGPGNFFRLGFGTGGDVVGAGQFASEGPARNVARWDGLTWSGLGTGSAGVILASARLPNGDVVVGGNFAGLGGTTAQNIARWNGTSWSALGAGLNSNVTSVAVLPNGDVVAGGWFSASGATPISRLARWNGSAWSDMGGAFGGILETVHVAPNGDLFVSGNFSSAGGVPALRVARWNGTTWSALGSGLDSSALAFASMPNGDLVAGGMFITAGGVTANRVARWNGVSWSALGSGVDNNVYSLSVLRSGDLVVGGDFQTAGGAAIRNLARWNGSGWSAFGFNTPQGRPYAVAELPNGDLFAAGAFTLPGVAASSNLARWNGSFWVPVGAGLDGVGRGIVARTDAELAVVGEFAAANGQPSAAFARYVTPCPASATPVGTACASSGGANAYVALDLPYAGATYRTRGTGLPTFAFVAVVNGFAGTAIPLGAVLAPSPAGCTLWVTPDVVDVTLSNAGMVDAQIALPNTPSFAGIVLHQQLVALEVDASLNFVQNTSTNGLMATIGAF